MPYTLLKFLIWGIAFAFVGGFIGWGLRSLTCRAEVARARSTSGGTAVPADESPTDIADPAESGEPSESSPSADPAEPSESSPSVDPTESGEPSESVEPDGER